jgi:hypothetical protein
MLRTLMAFNERGNLRGKVPFAFLIKCNISERQQMCLESLKLMKPVGTGISKLCLDLTE